MGSRKTTVTGEDQFTAQCGALFIGVGSGNAPRGARNEEVRPDTIVMDDFDTDEDCRNPDTVDKNGNGLSKHYMVHVRFQTLCWSSLTETSLRITAA